MSDMHDIDGNDIQRLEKLQQAHTALKSQIEKVIVGQEDVIRELLVSLFAGGHCLLVGVPGLAKTLLVSTLARVLDLRFNRVQFTPDLMPSDITGTEILEEDRSSGKRVFKFVKGPIFTNVLLADEINRTPPKTQAALLQAMQEYQVTAGGETYSLARPFYVLATQNPIEQEGTYPLPEAQLDRFMLKVKIGYPSKEEERKIVDRMASGQPEPEVKKVAKPDDIRVARQVVDQTLVDDKVRDYIVDLVQATRDPAAAGIAELDGMIENGASPRASIALMKTAKAQAFLRGRSYATPHDVKSMAADVLRHRIILTYEAEAEGKTPEDIIERILVGILVP